MTVSQERLLDTLNGIRNVKALVVGDLVLDRYIWGKVERISPEAPVPVVHVQKVEDRLGCAGNAVANLRALGAQVRLCSLVGDDDEGKIAQQLLAADGVDTQGMFINPKRPTIVKTRVIAHSQQVVRIDREETETDSLWSRSGMIEYLSRSIEDSDVIVLSDYGKGIIDRELLSMVSLGARLNPERKPIVVDPHPQNFPFYSGITVAKPNRAEAEQASGIKIRSRETALQAAGILLAKWQAELMLITLGEDGLVLVFRDNSPELFLPTQAREVFDVSGAGDTVTAVFSAALALGVEHEVAGELANIAAGIVVSEIGTAPISLEKLRSAINARKG